MVEASKGEYHPRLSSLAISCARLLSLESVNSEACQHASGLFARTGGATNIRAYLGRDP